jgi:hypothetical protein
VSIGRGATGLLSGLRTFADLVDDSATDRQQILDLSPGIVVSGWTVHSGSVWKASCHHVYDHRLRDVVSVETMVEPRPLARVESQAVISATAGSFFFDFDAAVPAVGAWWDDGITEWDGGATWDTYPTYTEAILYVHLPDASNPNNTTVVAHLGFHVAGDGKVLPFLGASGLADGALDTWTTPTNLTNWTETGTWRQHPPLKGTGYSARISGSIATGYSPIDQGARPARLGAHYFFSGTYYTAASNPAQIEARVRVRPDTGGANYMSQDGRETTTNGVGMTLANTNGEVRRFLFVFRCPVDTTALQVSVGAYNTGGAVDGDVIFDDVKLQRVFTYSYYEPRLNESSVPETEVAVPGIYYGERTVGLGTASILIGDGATDKAFGTLLWPGTMGVFATGGAFQDGQELDRSDYRTAFSGILKKPGWNDEAAKLEMEDAATFLRLACPPNEYSLEEHSNLFLNDEGYKKPLWWGAARNFAGAIDAIRPVRRDKSASTLYGTYECCDPSILVNGVVQIAVRSYPTIEDAERGTREYVLTSSYVTVTLATASFAVIDDVRNYRYDRGGEDVGTGAAFDFNIGGGALVATVNLEGPATLVASTLQAAMNAAAGTADITVAYSHTTHKFTVGKGAGTLNLLMKTGVNSHIASWAIFGFDLDVDRTGSLSYLGDNATFTDPDVDHIIRVVGTGAKDDASGTITGFANNNIEVPADVAVHLLMKVGKRPASQLNLPSFRFLPADAGFTASPNLRVWLREASTLAEALALLERSAFADIVIDGDGIIHFRPTALMTVKAEFFDRDFLSFEMEEDTERVFRAVRTYYGINPQLGSYRSRDDVAPESAGVPVKYGRDEVLEVLTALREDQNVEQLDQIGVRYARLAAANPKTVRFTAMSKLLDLLVGDKVELTRARAKTPTGRLDAAVYRIRGLRHNYMTGVSTCTAVEDVPFLFSA